jgi:hypothetical protein
LKKKRKHILRVFTIILLGVFSLAITPWSALHHHEQVAKAPKEKNCTHQFHVKAQENTCLICAAHFEKNYTVLNHTYTIFFYSELMTIDKPIVSGSFTALISTSLRGPPSYS